MVDNVSDMNRACAISFGGVDNSIINESLIEKIKDSGKNVINDMSLATIISKKNVPNANV